MKDLEKLNNIVENLEQQSNNLKSFSEVYLKIGSLEKEISDGLVELRVNNSKLNSVSKSIDSNLNSFHSQITNLGEENRKFNEVLYNDFKQFQKELDTSLITRLERLKSDIIVEVRDESKVILNGIKESNEEIINSNNRTKYLINMILLLLALTISLSVLIIYKLS